MNDKYELVGSTNIWRYLHGGHAVVTLLSPSNIYKTYSFEKPRHDEFPNLTLFVYCRLDNGSWAYVGMLENDKFRLTRASKFRYSDNIVKGVNYIVKLMNSQIFNSPIKFYHSSKCSVCGRQLTTPESITKGIGPKCLKHVKYK